MSESLAHEAFRQLSAETSNWQRLQVKREENRLLAVFLWLLIEDNKNERRLVDSYSKALKSVVDSETRIASIEALLKLRHVGKKIAKAIAEDLWRHYPPAPIETETTVEKGEIHEPKEKRKKCDGENAEQERKKPVRSHSQRRAYCPALGTANYAFLICLLQGLERGEGEMTKAVLMARAEKSGLSDSSIYGNDPLVQRQKTLFAGASCRILAYTGWRSTATLTRQNPPLAKIYGRPKKIVLTSDGVELARKLKLEAEAAGKLKDIEPLSPSPPSRLEPGGEMIRTALDETALTERVIIDCPEQSITAVLPRPSTSWRDYAVQEVSAIRLPYSDPDSSFDDEFDVRPIHSRNEYSKELVLLVDQREQFSRLQPGIPIIGRTDVLESHLTVLKESGVAVEIRQLEVGDAMWIARKKEPRSESGAEYVLDWVVERKRVDDLAASIIDRRYEQQKYWLRRCGLANVIYLIEGNPDAIERGDAVRTATASTEVLDEMRVFKTRDYTDSLRFYARLTHAMRRHLNNRFNRGAWKQALMVEEFKTRLRQSKRVTRQEAWGLMLTRVPGIGPDTATAMTERFPTPFSLYQAYKRHKNTTSTAPLDSVLADTRSGADGRRLGPSKSRKLIKALLDA